VYADGYAPREVDFMVVEQHPTLLNVTLYPSKVGESGGGGRRGWQPPWLAAPRRRHPSLEPHEEGAGERGDRPYLLSANTNSIPSNLLLIAFPLFILYNHSL
jgi:hypothetical protein